MLSDIVNGEDLKEAARRQAAYLQSFPSSPDSYKTVTVGKKVASLSKRPIGPTY